MKLTICLAYYDNPTMLAWQVGNLNLMDKATRERVELMVVDDCSPTWPAFEVLRPIRRGIKTRLFRMDVNIPWNQDACRNLAVEHAATDWVLLTDVDHLTPERTIEGIFATKLDKHHAYTFARVSAPAMEPYKPHPNSWLMTRALYDEVGGYDERFAGVYGTDGKFKNDLMAVAPIAQLKHPLIRVPREMIADASTTSLTRKSEENAAQKRAIDLELAALPADKRRPVRGRFQWKRLI